MTVKQLLFTTLRSIERDPGQTTERRADASFNLSICYQNGFGCDASSTCSLSCISRAAELGHEAASGVVKRLYEAENKPFPKGLDLETCLKRGIQAGSAIAEQDFRSTWSVRKDGVRQIRQSEWLRKQGLDIDVIDKQFWDCQGNWLPKYALDDGSSQQDGLFILNPSQTTILHYLAILGESQKLDLLLEHNRASVTLLNSQNAESETPIIAAYKCRRFKTFKTLLRHGPSITESHWAHENCLH
jgi:hypothetical protein